MDDREAGGDEDFAGADFTGADVTAFVEADPETVYEAFTSAEELERWWWPMFDDTRYEVDAQEGGWYRIRTATGGFGVQGRYLQLVPGRRIVQTWDWLGGYEDGALHEQIVTISLQEAEGGTRIRVLQTTPADEADAIREGWEDCLVRLEELHADD